MRTSYIALRKELWFSLLFFGCFLVVAYFRGAFHSVDVAVNLWSASINMSFFTEAFTAISVGFDTIPLLAVSVIVAFLFFIFHHRRYGFLLLGAMAGDAILVELCKTIVVSHRPLNEIILEPGYSFPSGHTTSSVVLFGVLVFFVWSRWRTRKTRVLSGVVYVLEVVIVGFDRIYLNVHWFTDILGAVFLGAFWVALCIWFFRQLAKAKKSEKIG
jgi:undecaprenyl-diphosphatase